MESKNNIVEDIVVFRYIRKNPFKDINFIISSNTLLFVFYLIKDVLLNRFEHEYIRYSSDLVIRF